MVMARGDEWVVVRRGRRPPPRRVQFFHPTRDGSRVNARRKDRAFSISHQGGRWTQSSNPNRPVPPTSMTRNPPSRVFNTFENHPDTRTYASVLRQGLDPTGRKVDFNRSNNETRQQQRPQQRPQYFNNNQRQRRQNYNNNNNLPQLEPQLFQLARRFFKMIKMVHHLQNVAPKPDKPDPIMITKMVENLATLIKPASPTPETLDLIMGNAKNWGYNTLTILENHYKEELEKTLEDLSTALLPNWNLAFQTAKRWARNHLSRIQEDVLEHVEALITANHDPNRVIEDSTETIQTQPIQKNTTTTNQETQTTQTSETQTEHIPRQRNNTSPAPKQTIGTMTDPEWSPLMDSPNPLDSDNEPLAIPIVEETPKQQRPQHTHQRNACVVQENQILLTIDSDIPDPTTRRTTFQSRLSEPAEPPRPTGTLVQVHHPPISCPELQTPPPCSQEQQIEPREEDDLMNFFNISFPSTPTTPLTFKVKRHITTQRKSIDWGLSVNKKWLFLGDSNLSRFPPYTIPNLQIESFPGANFRHAQEVMSKSTVHVTVEKVLLSFGINSRTQKAKETAVKQLQGALREAKKQYPYSEIWIPLINFSPSLPDAEKATLQILNQHIQKNMPHIPALTEDLFRTTPDRIHWTRDTAQAMMEHWTTYLNLNPPQAH